jgi:ATP-dependent Clp protease protease subunit
MLAREKLLDEKTRNWYLSHGIVLIGGAIGKEEAIEVLARLEYLESRKPGEEVKILINSPGGSVKYSLAIHGAIRKLQVPVATGCAGMADGSAALLLASGTKGRRSALPHAVIHVTDLWRASDDLRAPEQLEEVDRLRGRLLDLWVGCTGHDAATVRNWMSSQRRFTAAEALEAGIVDFIVPSGKSGGENGDILGLFRP